MSSKEHLRIVGNLYCTSTRSSNSQITPPSIAKGMNWVQFPLPSPPPPPPPRQLWNFVEPLLNPFGIIQKTSVPSLLLVLKWYAFKPNQMVEFLGTPSESVWCHPGNICATFGGFMQKCTIKSLSDSTTGTYHDIYLMGS